MKKFKVKMVTFDEFVMYIQIFNTFVPLWGVLLEYMKKLKEKQIKLQSGTQIQKEIDDVIEWMNSPEVANDLLAADMKWVSLCANEAAFDVAQKLLSDYRDVCRDLLKQNNDSIDKLKAYIKYVQQFPKKVNDDIDDLMIVDKKTIKESSIISITN